jgi:hypothetical protein
MAVTAVLSNHFKYQNNVGNIDFDADTFKVILMDPAFAFDKDAHATLADVTANQIAAGNGYTQDDKTLAGVAVDEDDTNDRSNVTWDDVSWTASGGAFPAIGAAVAYDDTTPDDTVVGCIDFGADYTVADGLSFLLKDIEFRLA